MGGKKEEMSTNTSSSTPTTPTTHVPVIREATKNRTFVGRVVQDVFEFIPWEKIVASLVLYVVLNYSTNRITELSNRVHELQNAVAKVTLDHQNTIMKMSLEQQQHKSDIASQNQRLEYTLQQLVTAGEKRTTGKWKEEHK